MFLAAYVATQMKDQAIWIVDIQTHINIFSNTLAKSMANILTQKKDASNFLTGQQNLIYNV